METLLPLEFNEMLEISGGEDCSNARKNGCALRNALESVLIVVGIMALL